MSVKKEPTKKDLLIIFFLTSAIILCFGVVIDTMNQYDKAIYSLIEEDINKLRISYIFSMIQKETSVVLNSNENRFLKPFIYILLGVTTCGVGFHYLRGKMLIKWSAKLLVIPTSFFVDVFNDIILNSKFIPADRLFLEADILYYKFIICGLSDVDVSNLLNLLQDLIETLL